MLKINSVQRIINYEKLNIRYLNNQFKYILIAILILTKSFKLN